MALVYDPLQRILAYTVITEAGCWEWIAGTNGSRVKYGRIGIWDTVTKKAKQVYTHKYVAEQVYGVAPEGYEWDHLCKNPLCCCPFHLEAVPKLVNLQRQSRPNSKKTHCKRGHDISTPDTYRSLPPKSIGHSIRRDCLTCSRERGRLWQRDYRKRKYGANLGQ